MHKILVIGQDNRERKSILKLLIGEGVETVVAKDSTDGLPLAQAEQPDLILCTLDLDGGDSQALLQALQSSPDAAVIPVILLTVRSDRTYLRHCIELGADDCLTHPATPTELMAAIRSRLQKQARLTERYVAVLRKTAERLNRLAHYDHLTELPNHHLLRQRLRQAMSQGPVALLCLSLDRLRQVNNTLGHPAGDDLLRLTASRLRASLPHGTTVARLTGNQFAILLSHPGSREAVRTVANDLIKRLSLPFALTGQDVFVTISIGIALYPNDSTDLDTLLRQVDAALEGAKRQKSHYCQFYRADMPVVSGDDLQLETNLRYALERHEFDVYYQPQRVLGRQRSSSVPALSAEALIRWTHPQQGFISPGRFIPLAEETGLIVPIGEWILRQTCTQVKTWQQQGLPPIKVSVNLSSVQLNQPHLPQTIAQILQETGLSPQLLELELTETALMQDATAALAMLSELKTQGLRIAVDDFGTGYSSLSYLKQFPIDTLKIDRCFVNGLTTDAKNQVILTAMIEMAHALDLYVVAEGVETEAELALLQDYQCDSVQGYLLGQPMASKDFYTWCQAMTLEQAS
ncbi:GGDEF domain-containing response regulator [Halomicronema hongdechloris C2206]|uniref:GGDEF domain-containing response regulator n=1 Tax=Halomicronema hongdechloris C2206 TaxID=1641165 RepID=A0A1Z3HUL7_9CYAN|nr:EAL domain-containing protein [Halomicronema hongdechloris]ASC73976.1 GGDEF domain-containing response regulator [Halomicronema hongdechloris C2206]